MPLNAVYALIFFIVIIVVGLTACSPTRALNAVVPSGSYSLNSDVPYSDEHPRQTMDIYLPETTTHKQNVIVFMYGGAWEEGDKADFEFVGQAFARLGYITIIPNYRLFPEVEFPAFIEDAAAAVTAIPGNLPEQCNGTNANERGIILMGHSAGAHSAAMLMAEPSYLRKAIPFSAFIGLAGPYDLPLEHERVREKFSKVQGDEANPVALIANREATALPPFLLLHGESDTVAKAEHSESFAAALTELGVPVEFKSYPSRRHVALVASLASPLRFWAPTYADIQLFLNEHGLDTDCSL